MKTFKDQQGREWTVAVNVDAIKRVRGLLDVNLFELVENDGNLLTRLVTDPILLCDVVYCVCKPEADAKNVSDEEFGRAMAGDAIDHATKALLDELTDFSPSPRDRANIKRALEAVQQVMERTRDLVDAKLDSGVLDQAIDSALESVKSSFGNMPESSASTRAPSPSPS